MNVYDWGNPLAWDLGESPGLSDIREGTPTTSEKVLSGLGAEVEVGVWEVTPGTFHSYKPTVVEHMLFLSGSGEIIEDGMGRSIPIEPGRVVSLHPGASFTWKVTSTLRKFYVIIPQDSGATH